MVQIKSRCGTPSRLWRWTKYWPPHKVRVERMCELLRVGGQGSVTFFPSSGGVRFEVICTPHCSDCIPMGGARGQLLRYVTGFVFIGRAK